MGDDSGSHRSLDSLGKTEETRSALRYSISKAVTELESRLVEDVPKVAELAEVAGLSKSHFQLAFRAVVGESVTQHLVRLRIERGASFLKSSSWQVGEIALVCGYKTQASFTRDFKKHYGMSPQMFRMEKGLTPYLRGRLRSRPDREFGDSQLLVPTTRIETWPDLEAVCLRVYSTMEDLHSHWRDACARAEKFLPGFENARFFGLWFDEWSENEQDVFRYECALVSPHPLIGDPPAPFFRRTIPGGDVAVAHAQGREAELDRAWRAFAQGWLPYSGFQTRLDYAMDEYPKGLLSKSYLSKIPLLVKGISLSMCLPVQKEGFVF